VKSSLVKLDRALSGVDGLVRHVDSKIDLALGMPGSVASRPEPRWQRGVRCAADASRDRNASLALRLAQDYEVRGDA